VQMLNKSNSNGQIISKGNRVFEAAIAEDNAWFAANPGKTSLRRKVKPRELPRALRHQGIREIVIERAGPSQFIRRFLDIDGRAIASGLDLYQKPVVPSAPQGSVQLACKPDGRVGPPIGAGPRGPDSDREYFEKHPDATEFTRPATAEELAVFEVPPGVEWIEATVTVTQLRPGFRLRRFDGAYCTPDGVKSVRRAP
jgi:hypothetical protein